MPYMGIQELKDANIKSGSATGDGSTTTFAIGWTPPSEQALFVTINGVLQSDSALSISGANCVFTAAPASADAIEFKGIQSGGTVTTLGDGVVNAAQLGSSSVVTASIVDANVTIAKIAGSAAAAAGTYLQQNGTWSEVASGTTWQTVKTADFTAVAGEGYPCNTTAGALTATLPTSPTAGDTIEFFDYAGTFDTNRLLITPAGSDKIKSEALSFEMIKERSGASLTFFDATQGWIPTSGINEGTKALAVPSYSVESLIIAGGGAGTNAAYNGGGGGGGTLYYGAETPKTPNGVALVVQLGSVYTVVIGTGGLDTGTGTNGTDTTFSGFNITTQTAVGGGNGGTVGGSGGGANHGGTTGAAGTAGQGAAGGSGSYCPPGYPGGGGGGSGGTGNSNSGCSTPGAGGLGLNYVITGSSVNYSAGGGGGTMFIATYGSAGGDSAGAGNQNAPDGRGGGGGAGGSGGDGCVILRMLTANYSGTTSGSPAVTTDGSYKVINFTASGTYTA